MWCCEPVQQCDDGGVGYQQLRREHVYENLWSAPPPRPWAARAKGGRDGAGVYVLLRPRPATKGTVVACLLRLDGTKEVRTVETTTAAWQGLADWLRAAGCTHAAMESTGVYWKPVYNVLDGACALLVVNAAHMKAVPGRKTDVRDAEWIADLLQYGLLRPSFIPDRAQRELRDLTRARANLIDERAAAVNRVQGVLEDANITLAGVAKDIMGVSGRAMLAALLEGVSDPVALAELAKGRPRRERAALGQALSGRPREHQRRLLALHLGHIDVLSEAIADLSAQIAERLRPFEGVLLLLETIPGVGRAVAEALATEVGLDRGRFPSAAHLASWAGMCPGNHESAGKQKRGTTRRGNRTVRRALTEAAHAAARTKKLGRTALATRYRHLAIRCGKKKAAVAVGHTILRLVHLLLSRHEPYQEFAPAHLDERRRARAQRRALDQLNALGFDVTITPKEPAA